MARKRLLECGFYIPLRRDRNLSDGQPHKRPAWNWLRDRLFDFGGATQGLELHKGWYRDPDTGKVVYDLSQRFTVAIARKRLSDLRDMLRKACRIFAQKCIYLSVAGYVEFVRRRK